MKYLFGPVNSRRLGLSLGIDLVPSKTCSLNCLYCECGCTTLLTDRIDEYVPTADVLRELEDFLSPGPKLDVVTFSGSGEPTLHSGIGAVISFLKDRFPQYRIVVLTNGTMLWKDEVRKALMRADMVVPSLDAVSEEVFARMLRPAPGITAERTVHGILRFSREYRGSLVIEVFILPGVNDSPAELEKIRRVCLEAGPQSVQLNRLDRPGAEDWVESAGDERMAEIRALFRPLNVSVVGGPPEDASRTFTVRDIDDLVIATVSRRPSTLEDLVSALGISRGEILRTLERLAVEGRLSAVDMDRGRFYRLKQD